MDEAIFFKDSENTLFIRAQGHVTAALCPELKAKAFSRLDAAPPIRAVYIDLATCEYMDSTFLGLIVGINKRYKARNGSAVVLLHVNQTCLSLLKTIGVLRLVEISDEDRPFPKLMEVISLGPRATAEFILDAHEELSDLSEENKTRFSTLTQTLRTSIKKTEN